MANIEETQKIIADQLRKMSAEEIKALFDLMNDRFDKLNNFFNARESRNLVFKESDKEEEARARANFDEFLIELTVSKVKKALPKHEITENDKESLTYIGKEWALIRGTDEEKAQAKQARKERALSFYQSLSIEEQKTLVKKIAKKKEKKDVTQNILEIAKTYEIDEFITLKDRLFNMACGRVADSSGNTLSLVSESDETELVRLWDKPLKKNQINGGKQTVCVMANLKFNEEYLKKHNISFVGKKRFLSNCAQEVFGVLLSLQKSGNEFATDGMIGKAIFGVKDGSRLTEAQRKYILDGKRELLSTIIEIDNDFPCNPAKDRTISLKSYANEVEVIHEEEHFYPIKIKTVRYKGTITDGVEFSELPAIYRIQNSLSKGQIIRVDPKIRTVPGRIDDDLITIRNYLVYRVDGIKHKNSLKSEEIVFKNILSELEIDPKDRSQKNRITATKKRTKRVLEYWKEIGYIKGYEELKQNGTKVRKGESLHKIKIIT